ncbi:helix-turn-helix domain-containing protein [Actinomadura rayongensis]|uniref:Helix-turn-helix domain-containing protein n=1 Tax=Actinomadura rayongensis TaxID=1429076 RepID=A0A6I4VXN4_9ACTN|nr:helix-turn-helix domain-containing protein [Actinomadura rayongensis]
MTKKQPEEPQQPTLYTPAEVAMFFRVDPKTVTRWARTGTLHPITLPSGHRRYHAEEIHKLLQAGDAHADVPDPEPEPSPRARAVLHSVVRTYFNGDAIAAIKTLRTDLK